MSNKYQDLTGQLNFTKLALWSEVMSLYLEKPILAECESGLKRTISQLDPHGKSGIMIRCWFDLLVCWFSSTQYKDKTSTSLFLSF